MCAIVTIMIAQYLHISVAVDMRTLLDINNFSSSSNGQVAAQRVTAYYQKDLLIIIALIPIRVACFFGSVLCAA